MTLEQLLAKLVLLHQEGYGEHQVKIDLPDESVDIHGVDLCESIILIVKKV